MKMKPILYTIIAAALILIAISSYDGCNKVDQPRETQTLRDTLKQYDTVILYEKITKLQTIYRNRFDTFVKSSYDSTWNNICRIVDVNGTGWGCQREVGRRLLAGIRDSGIVEVYRSQRKRDSTAISILKQIDTIQTARISTLSSVVVKMQEKADRKRKWSRLAHAVAVGLGVFVLVR